jgi:hypothetical protein
LLLVVVVLELQTSSLSRLSRREVPSQVVTTASTTWTTPTKSAITPSTTNSTLIIAASAAHPMLPNVRAVSSMAFCSKDHLRQAWPRHERVCKVFRSLQSVESDAAAAASAGMSGLSGYRLNLVAWDLFQKCQPVTRRGRGGGQYYCETDRDSDKPLNGIRYSMFRDAYSVAN